VFTTPTGAAIDEANFYHREWLPMLRRLKLRPRPFYNTRHSYISFMLSSGHSALFVSKQAGDKIETLEKSYAKYLPEADTRHQIIEASIRESADKVRTGISEKIAEVFASEQKGKSPRKIEGLKLERVRRVELPTLCLASMESLKRTSDGTFPNLQRILDQTATYLLFDRETFIPERPFETL